MTTTHTPWPKRQTWVSVLIAAAIVVVVAALVIIAGGVLFFYQHIDSTEVTEADAVTELQRTRGRFASQHPLLEVTTGRTIRHPTPDGPRRLIAAVHMISYDNR